MSETHLTATFVMQGELEHKVHAIKQVRSVTGLGLREAKEFVEEVQRNGSSALQIQGTESLSSLKSELLRCNIAVFNENLQKYAEQLREIASVATLAGDYYVARTLITLLDERF